MDNSFPLNPRTPQFQNFGELLYCAYSNLQMLMFALNSGKRRYDRACFMVRSKANKAYREGRWEINDLVSEQPMEDAGWGLLLVLR